ncbi:hypothetical protein M0802_012316 [Mischocyttarus mexicanus]|nr:hypothetical protein M0802_012316 [Mischocyttarus mexicanus]
MCVQLFCEFLPIRSLVIKLMVEVLLSPYSIRTVTTVDGEAYCVMITVIRNGNKFVLQLINKINTKISNAVIQVRSAARESGTCRRVESGLIGDAIVIDPAQ